MHRACAARDGQRFINVGEVLPGYVLRDIEVYEFEDRRLRRALHAERAHFIDGEWQVHGIDSTASRRDTIRTRPHAAGPLGSTGAPRAVPAARR
ncbi:MAG: hypothetical protein U5K43_14155 [Halofilum sp. (in: g-proteobacteria)]|nr:hypothetical protein [Halofilum sp. (in: g-proteobacteria)]